MNDMSEMERSALADPLPTDPMPIFQAWFAEAGRDGRQPNPNCFTLCTCTPDGRPSARVVLCKRIDGADPGIVFFTNYESRKSEQIGQNPRVAAVFHWDHAERQVRIEGTVVRATAAESDEYFASRRPISRLGAWASRQSRPIDSREALMEQVGEVMMRFGAPLEALTDDTVEVPVPRPPHWGGWRVRIERIELWQGGDGRLHDRGVWERRGEGWGPPTRLQP